MTRSSLISRGKLWQVHPDAEPDKILFEGSHAACLRFLRSSAQWHAYKRGQIRIGQLIWEDVK